MPHKERVTLNTRMNSRAFTDDFLGDTGTSEVIDTHNITD